MRRLRVFSVLLLLVGAGVALPAAAAKERADPPPTLTTVQFEDLTPTLVGSCNGDGSGTITFTASGTATGAYPGPYEVTGTATISDQPILPLRVFLFHLSSFTETFTINSPVGKVTGTKVLHSTSIASHGVCVDEEPGVTLGFLIARADPSDLHYTAEITTPDGRRFTDEGRTRASVQGGLEPGVDENFSEQFISNFPTAQPVCDKVKDKPGDGKDKCKDKK